MQRDSVYYVQRGVNLLIGVNRLGTQSRVWSIYYLWYNKQYDGTCESILATAIKPIKLRKISQIPNHAYNIFV